MLLISKVFLNRNALLLTDLPLFPPYPHFIFSRQGRVSSHLQGQRVLLLRPVHDTHPEQHRRDHAFLPNTAAQRAHAAHWQVGWLCKSFLEERRGLASHQPGLGGLWGSGGACQRQVQWQRLAWCARHPQPAPGKHCLHHPRPQQSGLCICLPHTLSLNRCFFLSAYGEYVESLSYFSPLLLVFLPLCHNRSFFFAGSSWTGGPFLFILMLFVSKMNQVTNDTCHLHAPVMQRQKIWKTCDR